MIPPPMPISPQDRQAAFWVHLSALAGIILPLGNIIGPLVVWQMHKDNHEFIDKNGKEAINFQITIMIASLVCLLIFFLSFFFMMQGVIAFEAGAEEVGVGALVGTMVSFILPFILLIVISIVSLIFTIIAAMAAQKGEVYHYPWTINFLK